MGRPKDERLATSVRLPAALVARLDAFCDQRVIGRNLVVTAAIERLLDDADNEAAEKARLERIAEAANEAVVAWSVSDATDEQNAEIERRARALQAALAGEQTNG